MTVAVDKSVAIPLIAGFPVNRVVVASISAAGTEGATAMNSLLGFSAAGVEGFILLSATTGALADQPYTLTSGALSLDPQTQASVVGIVVWGR